MGLGPGLAALKSYRGPPMKPNMRRTPYTQEIPVLTNAELTSNRCALHGHPLDAWARCAPCSWPYGAGVVRVLSSWTLEAGEVRPL